jgi:serine/threonine-protein kinase
MTDFKKNRRTFLAAGVTGAAAALAGCTGILADGRGVPGKSERIEDDDGEEGPPAGIPTAVHNYLVENEANLYEEEMVDHTGEDSVTVEVGAGGQGFAFNAPLINVDPGTEVTWEWTGEGGGHNVSPDGDTDFEDFGSDEIVDESGHTVESTFEETGAALYVCVPHRAQGMAGGIAVTE